MEIYRGLIRAENTVQPGRQEDVKPGKTDTQTHRYRQP